MDPKLQVSAEVEVFEGRNHNYILVSLMNITDIYDYITEYSTFSFSVCTFSSERHILAIPKSMILLLIVLMKYILLNISKPINARNSLYYSRRYGLPKAEVGRGQQPEVCPQYLAHQKSGLQRRSGKAAGQLSRHCHTHLALNSSSALFISISSLDISSLHAYLKNKYLLYNTSHYPVLCSLHKESPCKTHHKKLVLSLLCESSVCLHLTL